MTSNLGVWQMAVPKVITQLSCLEIFKGKRPTEGAGDDKEIKTVAFSQQLVDMLVHGCCIHFQGPPITKYLKPGGFTTKNY